MANYAGLTPADFEAAVGGRLLPRGLAWTRVAGSVLQGFWRVVADAVAAVHARCFVLTEREAFPPWSVELLPDWERVLGLPDPCLGPNPVTSARQAAVAARLSAAGGQSVPYFEALAATLGGTIAIAEYAPFRLGINGYGQPLYGAAWANTWLVTVSGAAIFYFKEGISSYGEPFWQIASNPIVCEIQRLKPAHTFAMFAAGAGVPGDGTFLTDFSLTDTLAGLA